MIGLIYSKSGSSLTLIELNILTIQCIPNLYELHEPFAIVDSADLGAQDFVQDLGDGEGEGRGDHHEQLSDPDGLGANSQGIARADGLGTKRLFHD
jgi:hypothetical protein